MLLIYRPADEPEQTFPVKPEKLIAVEAEAIEEEGGRSWETYEEFGRLLMKGQVKARRALLWVMLRRTNPALRFVDLGGVPTDEIDLDYDAEEKAELRASIKADARMSEAEKAEALAALGDDPAPDVEPGKDEPDAAPTDSTSPEQA